MLTGGVSNAPEGSIESQNVNIYDSDNFKVYFDTVTDDTLSLQSQITDNYVENNTAIQDHIAIAPITVTMHGLCGEKVFTIDDAQSAEMDVVAQQQYYNSEKEAEIMKNRKLGELEVYFPKVSNSTALAQNIWSLIQATKQKALEVADKIHDRFNPQTGIDYQFTQYNGLSSNIANSKIREKAYYLRTALQNRKAFIVNTPFGVFNNMYIQSVTLHQGNENYIAELDVTLKQIRFSEVETTAADQAVLSKYNAMQQADLQNNGKAKGLKSELARITDGEKGFF